MYIHMVSRNSCFRNAFCNFFSERQPPVNSAALIGRAFAAESYCVIVNAAVATVLGMREVFAGFSPERVMSFFRFFLLHHHGGTGTLVRFAALTELFHSLCLRARGGALFAVDGFWKQALVLGRQRRKLIGGTGASFFLSTIC